MPLLNALSKYDMVAKKAKLFYRGPYLTPSIFIPGANA